MNSLILLLGFGFLIAFVVFFAFVLPRRAGKHMISFAAKMGLPIIPNPTSQDLVLPELLVTTHGNMGAFKLDDTPWKNEGETVFGNIKNLIKIDDSFSIFMNHAIYHPNFRQNEYRLSLCFLFSTSPITSKHRIILNPILKAFFTELIIPILAERIKDTEGMIKVESVPSVPESSNLYLSGDKEELNRIIQSCNASIENIKKVLDSHQIPNSWEFDYMKALGVIDVRGSYALVRLPYPSVKFMDEILPIVKEMQVSLIKS